MKTVNHTPLPWEIGHQLGDGFSIVYEIAPNCGKLVCLATCHNVGGQAFSGFPLDDETAKANRDLIIRAVNQTAKVDALVKALEDTATLSYELMERAARIDAKLAAVGGNPAPECELGEIARLRGQLSKNRVSIANLNT